MESYWLHIVAITTLLAISPLCYHAWRRDDPRGQCNIERRMEVGEVFTFRSFPSRYFTYGQSYIASAPEECTWKFKSEDCMLEYRTEYYERGDVDCEQQYFLIGDELTETRFCGFTRPPNYLRSSGKQLLLTHYQRNEYQRTVSSYLGGVVRCLNQAMLGQNAEYQSYECNSEPLNCTLILNVAGTSNGSFITAFGDFGGKNFSLKNQCNSIQCNLTVEACIEVDNVAPRYSYSNAPCGDQVPSNECKSITVQCPTTGPCSGKTHAPFYGGGVVKNITCDATENQRCSEIVTICFKTIQP